MLDDRALHAHQRLLDWYRRQGRPLPWRQTRDPYAVLVSELMLQQTQVARVLPKYQEFLARFPTLEALAAASRAEVIRCWAPLGYNLRAVRLHTIARQAVERGGSLPDTVDELLKLSGLGRYTAFAVACFAFEQPVAVLDTNIRRVLARVFLGEPDARGLAAGRLWELAETVLPREHAYNWNQALMDLGATICTARTPGCGRCPLADLCLARDRFAGQLPRRRVVRERRAAYQAAPPVPRRVLRGRLVQLLRALPGGAAIFLEEAAWRLRPELRDPSWLAPIAEGLARDELIELRRDPAGAPGSALLRLPVEEPAAGADTEDAPGAIEPA